MDKNTSLKNTGHISVEKEVVVLERFLLRWFFRAGVLALMYYIAIESF